MHRIQVQSTARGVNQGAHIVLSVKARVQSIVSGRTWERGLFRRDMLLVLKWTPVSRVQSVAGEDGMTIALNSLPIIRKRLFTRALVYNLTQL